MGVLALIVIMMRVLSSYRLRRWLGASALGLFLALGLAWPGLSVEYIFVNLGPLGRSIPVASLETYARTGEITEDLEWYTKFLTPEQLQRLREGLVTSADVDVVTVSQFLYTSQGEAILDWLG